jgi:cell division protein FtsW (lipid II flippase)
MAEFVTTVILLVFVLLWFIAWQRQRRFAVGVLVGIVAALVATTIVHPFQLQRVPLWLPPLPFALVAVSLFGFGVLAWFWGED